MTQPCPACGAAILVVDGSRHGGQKEAFDPDPGNGDRYNTKLSADLSCIDIPAAGAGNLMGRIPLYRSHRWTCTAQMRIPSDRPLPRIGGYSHKAAARKGDVAPPEPSWPQPWEGIKGSERDGSDLLSLEEEAMPRRRVMVMMALAQYSATQVGSPAPKVAQMGRRMRSPQPGDLVVEVTRAHGPLSEHRGFGILLAARKEWVQSDGEWAALPAGQREEGRSVGEAWYIQYGPEPGDVARWTDAQVVAVLADERVS